MSSSHVLPEIGHCSVCQRMARLEHQGCSDCYARFGQRFLEVAARVRSDAKFAAMVLDAIQDPAHKKLFVQYFGADGDCPPPRSYQRYLDGLR